MQIDEENEEAQPIFDNLNMFSLFINLCPARMEGKMSFLLLDTI